MNAKLTCFLIALYVLFELAVLPLSWPIYIHKYVRMYKHHRFTVNSSEATTYAHIHNIIQLWENHKLMCIL